MEEKIVKVLNEMSAYLTIAQMKKLQEIMLDTFAENKIENRNEDQWYFLQMVSKQKLLITNIRNEKYQHFILNEISKSFLIFRQ